MGNQSIKFVLGVIGGFLGSLFGGWDGFMYALLLMMFLDLITGPIKAVIRKEFRASIMALGIAKKFIILVIVAVTHILDFYVFKADGVVRTGIIFFYTATEAASIIENAAIIGIPIPQKLVEVLATIKDKEGDLDKK